MTKTTLDLDYAEPRACSACGWSGPTRDAIDLFEELLALRCPKCDARVGGLYLYPTDDEVREAAAAGNAKAIAELPRVDERTTREQAFEATKLREARELPDVEGDATFVARWSLEQHGGDSYVALRVDEQELWREVAHYEDLPRFEVISGLLRERYEDRLLELRPDAGEAIVYILGDRISWADGIERANAWIASQRLPAEAATDTPLTTGRFDDALAFASAHHRRQLRKGTPIPYVAHLLAVAAIVLEMRGSEDEAIAALLHDVVEDGGGPTAATEIRKRFGSDVADMVLANSDTDIQPKPPWRKRKKDYIAAIAHKTPGALRVSLADKLHNARAILQDFRTHGDAVWLRFNPREGKPVRWYYRALTEAFEARKDVLGEHAMGTLEELRRTVDDLDRLAGDRPSGVLPRLYVSLERDGGTLSALEFGRIDDGQPDGTWEQLADDLALMLDPSDGRPVGFLILDLAPYDPDDVAHAPFWEGPRFDVPQLGLHAASINETVVATRALYGDGPSLNRELFSAAIADTDDDAYSKWMACLQAGDPTAHLALGYTLLDQGRHQEAYRHLRHYTEISPAIAWNWVYRARAAQALGHLEETHECLRRAVALDREAGSDDQSEAADALGGLLDVGARGTAFADLVESTHLAFALMKLEWDELALLDGPGFAALLRLTLDDRLTVEVELGSNLAADDLDDHDLAALHKPLRGGDSLRLDAATGRLWLTREVEEHEPAAICAILDELAPILPETVALLDQLAEGADPPLTFDQRDDGQLPPR